MVTWELIDGAPLWRYRCTLCGYRGVLKQKLRKRLAANQVVRCPGCYAKKQLTEAAVESAQPRMTFRSEVKILKLRRLVAPMAASQKPCMRCGSFIPKTRLRKCSVCREAEAVGIIRPFNPARFKAVPKQLGCACCGVTFCDRCAVICKAEKVAWRRVRSKTNKRRKHEKP